MKRILLSSSIVLSFGVLAGCRSQDLVPPPVDVPVQEPVDAVSVELKGTIEHAELSIYMEGTHTLRTDDGGSILLQSAIVDLNEYLGMQATVRGVLRPTVEQGGTVMDVTDVAVLQDETPILLEPLDDAASSSSEAMSVAPPLPVPVASSAPSASLPSSSVAQAVESSVSSQPEAVVSSSSAVPDASDDERVAIMAKADADAANFTQPFCSRQAGFCVPLHKSWYYQSFGATSSSLWHVEVNAEEVQKLGDGPLVVNLLSGPLDSSIADGSVRLNGNVVVGYRAWTGNRHFQISAPASLRAAVTHMTEDLSVYQLETQGASSSADVSSSSASSL